MRFWAAFSVSCGVVVVCEFTVLTALGPEVIATEDPFESGFMLVSLFVMASLFTWPPALFCGGLAERVGGPMWRELGHGIGARWGLAGRPLWALLLAIGKIGSASCLLQLAAT